MRPGDAATWQKPLWPLHPEVMEAPSRPCEYPLPATTAIYIEAVRFQGDLKNPAIE
jgi:hypothetical protein